MHVLKFGGTSVGSASRLLGVVDLIVERADSTRVGVVVSAVAGITNLLVSTIPAALSGLEVAEVAAPFRERHADMLADLLTAAPALDGAALAAVVDAHTAELETLLRGAQLLSECPLDAHARILSLGERVSARLLAALLRGRGVEVDLLDPGHYIRTKGPATAAEPVLAAIEERCAPLRTSGARVLLLPGFIGADHQTDRLTLLGRNGSDLSGALLAVGLRATRCEIWTDVDGIFSADPRLVPDAQLVPEMSYEEAMELSFFGAKVLHPQTIGPLARHRIPTWIRNTHNPKAPGSLICAAPTPTPEGGNPVRGITCLENVALLTVAGSGMKGLVGVAARILNTVARRGASLVLISQSSSEYALSFGIAENQADDVAAALQEEFALELQAALLDPLDVRRRQAVICLVGEPMRTRRGVAGTFFQALAHAAVNIAAISQGASERSISAVIDGADRPRELRAVHQQFFQTAHRIEVVLLGVGTVGASLLDQLQQQQPALLASGIDVRVCAVANSRHLLLNPNGLNLTDWRTQLAAAPTEPVALTRLLDYVRAEKPLNPVLVDCTSSEVVADFYLAALRGGLHVVTANKKANSGALSTYRALRQTAAAHRRRFQYETNVGAGLPVIDTLQNLLRSGDHLTGFAGILSGSLSFIFGLLEDGVTFSAAVTEARRRGFTEPDPRDDLSGLDVARKLLILHREAGGAQELADVEITSIFPPDFDATGSVEEFMRNIPALDSFFQKKIKALTSEGKVLRFAGEITAEGHCRVGLMEVEKAHPLAAIRGGENALAFTTRRYSPVPLVIRGYGAGAEVTAAGVFADVLRVG